MLSAQIINSSLHCSAFTMFMFYNGKHRDAIQRLANIGAVVAGRGIFQTKEETKEKQSDALCAREGGCSKRTSLSFESF